MIEERLGIRIFLRIVLEVAKILTNIGLDDIVEVLGLVKITILVIDELAEEFSVITLDVLDILNHVFDPSLRRLFHTVAVEGHQFVIFVVHFILVAAKKAFQITIKL